MKTVLKLSTVIMAAILAVSTSYAGEGDKPKAEGDKARPDGEGKGARGEGLFARVDTNKDGKIDKDELAGVKEEKLAGMLKKWDANNDGEIDDKEMTAARDAMKERRKNGEGRRKKGAADEAK